MKKIPKKNTSWHQVGRWYQEIVGLAGHYYHQRVIIPGVLKLLSLQYNSSLLDLACGQGVLARHIPRTVYYQGVDSAFSLIQYAKGQDKQTNHQYILTDITKPLPLAKKDFTHAAIILALQNIENPNLVLANAKLHLRPSGKLVIVINHPCFRIPRQSSWEIDPNNKLEYRRINRYLSPIKVPITTHPGKSSRSPITWSFHYPISAYSEFMYKQGFLIAKIEEWVSNKTSVGKAARMENRARQEFPLFMAVLAIKT